MGDIVECGWTIPSIQEDIDPHSLKAVYYRMARKWHPDAGGTHEAMQVVNEFYEELQQST